MMQVNQVTSRNETSRSIFPGPRVEEMKKWIVEHIPVGSLHIIFAGSYDSLSLAREHEVVLKKLDPRQITIVRPNPLIP